MKELSIEEKAKAYEEVLALMQDCIPDENGLVHIRPEDIFPKLAESKDEKIRKWLICTLKSLNNSPVQIDGAYEMMLPAIDWLEKQGEQEPTDVRTTGYWRVEDIEHKPAVEMITPEESLGISSEEYNKIVDECIYGDDDKNPTWSEEDEKIFSRICGIIHHAAYQNCDTDEDGNELGEYAKIINWLKYLRPQTTWKPSEEQLKALNAINVTGCISYAGQGQELVNLFNDLKKLKE